MSLREILAQNEKLKYRLEIADEIDAFVDMKNKTVLDAGCQTGHYGFLMLEHGAQRVTALDTNKFLVDVVNAIGARRARRFRARHTKIQDFVKADKRHFDVVLLLNVFHWLLGQGKPEAWETLNALLDRSDVVFLMMGVKEWDALKEFDFDIPRAVEEMTGCVPEPLFVTGYRGRTLYAIRREKE